MSAPEKEFIYVQSEESIALSAYRDAITFGAICGSAWFLNTQMPPSGWLNAALAAAWFLWMLGRSKRHIMTPEQCREHLDALLIERERGE